MVKANHAVCITSYFNSHKVQAAVYKPKLLPHTSMFRKCLIRSTSFPFEFSSNPELVLYWPAYETNSIVAKIRLISLNNVLNFLGREDLWLFGKSLTMAHSSASSNINEGSASSEVLVLKRLALIKDSPCPCSILALEDVSSQTQVLEQQRDQTFQS